MSRVKNADRELLNLKLDDETDISHSRSADATMSRPDAVWVFPTGTVRDNGGVWADGVPLLREQQDDSGNSVCCACSVVSAYLQDCAGTGDLECDRRFGAHCFVCIGEAT